MARFDILTVLASLIVAVSAYIASLALYRLYLHPLAKFPGPKLAAVSFWYEFYWEVVQPGQLTFELERLHKQYGPILRITPNEVHILDSLFYDELYARGSGANARRHKSPRLSARFGDPTDCFSTWNHEQHKMRRAAINPFFSAKRIMAFQSVVRSKVTKLTRALVKFAGTDSIVPMNLAFMALTGDITTEYAFARSYDQLDNPGFTTTYDDCLKALYVLSNLAIHFPGIHKVFAACPRWLTAILNPTILPVVDFYADSEKEIRDIRTGINAGHKTAETPTIFHQMLITDLLPEHEKTDRRLGDEAVEIIGAGIITASWTMGVGICQLLSNPPMLATLRAELTQHIAHPLHLQNLEANADVLDWRALEQLPYLSGCVKEAIRLSGGVVTRAPRILPDEDLAYGDYTIPRGSEVSMTTWHVSMDAAIFPEPMKFDPTRWLRRGTGEQFTKNVEMDRWLVAFGKGPRQCAGINLAHCELYVTLAVLVRMFEMELAPGTSIADATWREAYMVPYPDAQSKGINVKITGLVKA